MQSNKISTKTAITVISAIALILTAGEVAYMLGRSAAMCE